jgi:ABC-type glucose/galactose transport system permease subunit
MNTTNQKTDKKRRIDLYSLKEIGVLVTALIIYMIVAAIEPRFLMYDNIKSILLYVPLIMLSPWER